MKNLLMVMVKLNKAGNKNLAKKIEKFARDYASYLTDCQINGRNAYQKMAGANIARRVKALRAECEAYGIFEYAQRF